MSRKSTRSRFKGPWGLSNRLRIVDATVWGRQRQGRKGMIVSGVSL